MPEALYALALLACPIGMGAMMWMMTRGGKTPPADADAAAKRAELAGLQAQIDQLRAAQRDRSRTDGPTEASGVRTDATGRPSR